MTTSTTNISTMPASMPASMPATMPASGVRELIAGLAALVDSPPSAPRGTALIVPPYGISADNLFMPAYILAQNGFRVIRFDPRNHVGRSKGAMYDFAVSTVTEDITAMLEATRPDVVIGFSLAAPSVLRALAQRPEPVPAVLAAPVVSMRYTLKAVLDEDYFVQQAGEHVVVLGEDIHGSRFIADCRASRVVDFEDSLRDGEQVAGALTLVAGTEDPWVCFEEVTAFAERRTAGPTKVVPVAVGTHQFNLNPTIAMTYMKIVLAECLAIVGAGNVEGRIPPLHEAISARKQVAQAEEAAATGAATEKERS